MGLADYFSKDSRGERALKKNIQRAVDKHAQSADRYRALEALRDDGSPEAILGLLRRFSLFYDKTIEDAEEKEWVCQALGEMGPRILPQLRKYMRETETLGMALKVLERVTSGDSFREVIRELCEQNDNSYVRDPSKKIQLVHFMGEHRDPHLAELLVPYLEDIDEGVRFTAVESLLAQKNRDTTLGPLLRLLLSPTEESRRVKIRILVGLARSAFPLGDSVAAVSKLLPDLIYEAKIDKEGRLIVPNDPE